MRTHMKNYTLYLTFFLCWFHLHDLTSFLFVFFWLFMEKRTKSLTMGDGNFEHVIFRWIHRIHRIHVFYCSTTSCYRSRKPKEIKSHPLVVGFFLHIYLFVFVIGITQPIRSELVVSIKLPKQQKSAQKMILSQFI